MKKQSKECVDEKPSTIKEERVRKDKDGKITERWEVDVPATVYYYETHRKCKHEDCKYEDTLYSSETHKN
jgi:hypothetical protein